ncbi:MAG: VanZ family protein [Planctomycetota bacterium]
MEATEANQAIALRLLRTIAKCSWVILVVYFVALAVGTHLPPRAIPAAGSINDKAVHVGMYCGLGFLAALAWRTSFGRFNRLAGLTLLVTLSLVGAVDEITQPFFHRSCDFGDWSADVVGAAIGLVCFRIALALYETRRRRARRAATALPA